MGELVYEHSVKQYILNNPHLFIPKNSQSKVKATRLVLPLSG